jgi:hypothetical protein
MAGYLEEYGVADERRSRIVRWLAISVAVLGIGALVLYFGFRTWPAKRQVRAFLGDLRRRDYQAAYRDWGCARSCPDYAYDKFMEDWGPSGKFPDPSAAAIQRSRYCQSGGVIVTVKSPKGGVVDLMYDRSEGALGFAPWPVCDPRIPAPDSTPAP